MSVQENVLSFWDFAYLCFNTSYVSVQVSPVAPLDIGTLVSIHHMCRFKRFDTDNKYILNGFNTSYVSVQDGARHSHFTIAEDCFNTSYVSVQGKKRS